MQTKERSYTSDYRAEILRGDKPSFINNINITLRNDRELLLDKNSQLESYIEQLNKKIAKLEYEKSALNNWVHLLY